MGKVQFLERTRDAARGRSGALLRQYGGNVVVIEHLAPALASPQLDDRDPTPDAPRQTLGFTVRWEGPTPPPDPDHGPNADSVLLVNPNPSGNTVVYHWRGRAKDRIIFTDELITANPAALDSIPFPLVESPAETAAAQSGWRVYRIAGVEAHHA